MRFALPEENEDVGKQAKGGSKPHPVGINKQWGQEEPKEEKEYSLARFFWLGLSQGSIYVLRVLTSLWKMSTAWPESNIAFCTILSSFLFANILPLLMLYFDHKNRKENKVKCEISNCKIFEGKPAICFKWRDSLKNISNELFARGKVKMRESGKWKLTWGSGK